MYAFSSKLAVLAMVFAFAFPMQAQAQEGTERNVDDLYIDILTYNVAGMWGPLSAVSDPEEYHTLISPLLNEYDLVLVQEDFSYHEALSKKSLHFNRSHPAPATFRRNAIRLASVGHPIGRLLSPFPAAWRMVDNDGLNRFSKYAMHAFSRVEWKHSNGYAFNGNDSLATKGFTFARHEIAPRVMVDVYNLHMDAGDDVDDSIARFQQVLQLLKAMDKASKGYPVIIAGDLNLNPRDWWSVYILNYLIEKGGLTDSAQRLEANEDSRLSPGLDRVLYRSSSSVQLEAISWQYATEFVVGNKDLSDHDPVHVKMRVSTNRQP